MCSTPSYSPPPPPPPVAPLVEEESPDVDVGADQERTQESAKRRRLGVRALKVSQAPAGTQRAGLGVGQG